MPVSELIETYDLEEFVERARERGPAGRPDAGDEASIMHHDAEEDDYRIC